MTNAMGMEAYQHGHVEAQAAGASEIEKVIMLLDGFFDELDRLKGHIEANNTENNTKSVQKLLGILDGLDVSLNMEDGGDLATKIQDLYNDVGLRIVVANEEANSQHLDIAREVMLQVKEGWEGIKKNLG